MHSDTLYELLERLANLMRGEERAAGLSQGLQPVQLQALAYLARANRYSNSPAGVADYLGLTKGTVSQTLSLLESRGLVARSPSLADRRIVHLHLSPAGQAILAKLLPPPAVAKALAQLPAQRGEQLCEALAELLRTLQLANAGKSFGVCASCRLFRREPQGFRCGLTQEALSLADSRLICREHAPPETV